MLEQIHFTVKLSPKTKLSAITQNSVTQPEQHIHMKTCTILWLHMDFGRAPAIIIFTSTALSYQIRNRQQNLFQYHKARGVLGECQTQDMPLLSKGREKEIKYNVQHLPMPKKFLYSYKFLLKSKTTHKYEVTSGKGILYVHCSITITNLV